MSREVPQQVLNLVARGQGRTSAGAGGGQGRRRAGEVPGLLQRTPLYQRHGQGRREGISRGGGVNALDGQARQPDLLSAPYQQIPLVPCLNRHGLHAALEQHTRGLARRFPVLNPLTGQLLRLNGIGLDQRDQRQQLMRGITSFTPVVQGRTAQKDGSLFRKKRL